MTQASLKEVFGRAGPVRDIARNQSGFAENLVLRPESGASNLDTIAATRELARCGLSLKRAKKAVEASVDQGELALRLPMVDSRDVLRRNLSQAGFASNFLTTSRDAQLDLRTLRRRLALTQEQFALVYGFELKTLQKYEQGERTPTGATLAYLTLIEKDPDAVKRMRLDDRGGNESHGGSSIVA